jgi:Las17-binding protein actin regulator
MKMVSAGAGLGIGVKDYRVIFVFENDKALSQFLDSGWSGSGQADAAAKAGEKGAAHSGAAEVAPGVWVYEITKNGLALQLDPAGHEVLQGRRPEQKVALDHGLRAEQGNHSSLRWAGVLPEPNIVRGAVMKDKAEVDQRASDAELIALVRSAQEEVEAHGELNEVNLLLRDFARELLKQRLLRRVKFVRMIDVNRPQ